MQFATYSCDSATGDLFENGRLVGKLITPNSGAWWGLIEAAKEAPLLQKSWEGMVAERNALLVTQRQTEAERDELLGALAGMYRIHGGPPCSEEDVLDHAAVVKRAETIMLRFLPKEAV